MKSIERSLKNLERTLPQKQKSSGMVNELGRRLDQVAARTERPFPDEMIAKVSPFELLAIALRDGRAVSPAFRAKVVEMASSDSTIGGIFKRIEGLEIRSEFANAPADWTDRDTGLQGFTDFVMNSLRTENVHLRSSTKLSKALYKIQKTL